MTRRWLCILALLVLAGCSPAAEALPESGSVPNQWATDPEPFTTADTELEAIREAAQEAAGEADRQAALSLVQSWFVEPESWTFSVDGVEDIGGEPCVRIKASVCIMGEDIELETFAVQPDGKRRYFQNSDEAGAVTWVPFQNDPCFASADSPDGRYRMMSHGMYMDGPSGAHALSTMELIDLESGQALWVGDSFLWNQFLWSPDSRYVAVSRSGRSWAECFVVDTENRIAHEMPDIPALMAVEPQMPPAEQRTDSYFFPQLWEDDQTLSVSAQWWTADGEVLYAAFEYNALSGGVDAFFFKVGKID